MTTFAIQTGASDIDKTGALNYALNNIGQGFQINTETGEITLPRSATPFSYAYPYLYIAFANSLNGVVDFDQYNFTDKLYYGLWNTATLTPGGSTNPAQYIWYEVAGGFGATKNLYYSVGSNLQVQFVIDTAMPASANYLWRQYIPVFGSVSGIDLTYLINATNIEGGTLASNGQIYVQSSEGGEWTDTDNFIVGKADTLFLNTVVSDTAYYIAMGETVGDYSIFDADTQMTYTTGSTSTESILTAPNIQSNALVNILPQSSEPAGVILGSITVADAVTWDPATASTTTPYVAFYNGVAWTKLG